MTLASFKQQGKPVFNDHYKMFNQIPSSDQRRTGYLYEISFLEIPGLTLHYNVSLNQSVDVLLADIEDQVTKAQMKALDVNKLLSLLKMPQ
ncbi:MAG: hypothetical protein EZS28_019850 [Streblomastix strix]|uniref:Uncharacterized protein n=1 Tax=Streblomastix strix TaxID=222440 RepID=A0A5J4VQQ9_9EUKA|nr:MAG: hypothetical protein EZS28_019850 [Streblomastix strix]